MQMNTNMAVTVGCAADTGASDEEEVTTGASDRVVCKVTGSLKPPPCHRKQYSGAPTKTFVKLLRGGEELNQGWTPKFLLKMVL